MNGSLNSEFSLLVSHKSLEDLLKKEFGMSASKIKGFGLSKKILNRPLKKRDVVKLSLNVVNLGMVNPEYDGPQIQILFEDDKVLVIEKPYNVHGHPLTYLDKNNCLSYLRSIGKGKLLAVNCAQNERGLLNRLDFGTSGVLFYLKSEKALKVIRNNFQRSVFDKQYLAICAGEINFEGSHVSLLKSSEKRGRKMKVNIDDPSLLDDKWQRGEIEIKPLKYSSEKKVSLIKISLKTGIRHQIRAQMAFLGHPLVGDALYGGPQAKRTFLHCYQYGVNVDKKSYIFRSDRPPLFEDFFDLDSCL